MGRYWLLGLGFLVAQAVGAAGIYKWVDANGQVHFGEHPPAETRADRLNIREAPPADTANIKRVEQRQKLLDSFQEQRDKNREEAKKAKDEKAKRRQQCNKAHDRLRKYQEARYIYDLDAKGERRIYSDSERSAAMKKARDEVKKYCKN